MATFPVFAPDGSIRAIPQHQLQAALSSGGKNAVQMKDPQGILRYIPEDQVQAATNAGGTLAHGSVSGPLNPPSVPKPAPPLPLMTNDQLAQQPNDSDEAVGEGANRITARDQDLVSGIQKGFLNLPGIRGRLGSYLEPANPAESVGKMGAETAEFAAPGGAISSAGKAVDAATATYPTALRLAARMAARGAMEGGSGAAISKLQGGNAGPAGVVGAVGGAAGPALEEAIPAIQGALKSSAIGQYSKFLNPTRITTKNITSKIVPELLERKQMATSPSALADTAAGKADEVGAQIDQAVSNFKPPTKATPNIKGLLPSPKVDIPTDVSRLSGTQEGGAIDAGSRSFLRQTPAVKPDPGIGTSAATVPDSVFGPKTVRDVQYLSGGAHPELSGEMNNPSVLSTRDPAALKATRDRLSAVVNSDSFAAMPKGEQDAYTSKLSQLTDVLKPGVALPKASQSAQSVIDHLENYKQGFKVNGVEVNPDAVKHASDLQDTIRQLGPDVSYQSLNRVRQILDKQVSRSGAYAGKSLSEGSQLDTMKEAANAIRGELAKQSPDIAKLNAEYTFWRRVGDVAGQTAQRQTGQQGPLARIFAPILGAAAGMSHGGDVFSAVKGAAALTVANEIIHHPAFRTFSAVQMNSLAKAIAAGDVQGVAKLATRLGTSAASQTGGNSSPASTP